MKKKEEKLKNGILHIAYSFAISSTYSAFWRCLKKEEKILKKFKKLLKKVLTNGNIYDILHERSTEGRKKQRSLKIEQQQINELNSR